MDQTPNLQLSLMANKQGQRATFHDDALKALDTLVMLSVIDRDLSSPPGSPNEGDRYIVKAPGSEHDAWIDDHVVVYVDGDWLPHEPQLGWTCYVQDEGMLLAWDGASWQAAIDVMSAGLEMQELPRLGVGTTADATNPLSAKLNNTLFVAKTVAEGGDGHLRYKLSKESVAKTLSLLFQDNFSGRAEIGLTGDDDFHFKVSPDGAAWFDALTIDRSTGKLTIGQGFGDSAAARAKLYAAPSDALAFNGMQVNGGVDVSQELGTTGATLVNNTAKYSADLFEGFYNHGAASAVVTSGQVAAASFGAALPGYDNAHRIKATTALSSIANADMACHRHRIEGHRVSRCAWGTSGAQPVSLAFQFHAMRTGTQLLRLSNAAGNRFYHRNVAVVAGWNLVRETIPGDTSGAWEKTASAGLIVEMFGAGKSASPATADAWGATGALSTSASDGVNQYSTNNDETLMTGLIVLPGVELPPADRMALLRRSFIWELDECQRYWEKTNNYATAPGTVDGGKAMYTRLGGLNSGVHTYRATWMFKVPKRSTGPTMTWYSPATGASGKVRDEAAGADVTATSILASENHGVVEAAMASGTDASMSLHAVANARM